jgi:hypothetical protein
MARRGPSLTIGREEPGRCPILRARKGPRAAEERRREEEEEEGEGNDRPQKQAPGGVHRHFINRSQMLFNISNYNRLLLGAIECNERWWARVKNSFSRRTEKWREGRSTRRPRTPNKKTSFDTTKSSLCLLFPPQKTDLILYIATPIYTPEEGVNKKYQAGRRPPREGRLFRARRHVDRYE